MVTADGLVKVMDFGLARLTSDSRLTQDGTVLGTPAYMAPEQLEGIDVDARADVWALGVVFYEMLAGRLPFEAEYHQALLYAVMHEQPEPLTDTPEELAAIVAKALEKDPAPRYADAAEMGAAIEAFVEADRGSAATPPPPKQGGEWTSKQRLFGLPLVHVASGYDPATGRIRIAKGIIAIGNVAVGGVAVGGVSLGAIAIGGVTAGIVSLGGVALALWMAFGAVTVGMDPQGVVAIGPEGTRVMEQTIVEQAASSEEESEPPSVAVMPFVNSSGDPDFEYFSDGMTDELINGLSKIKGLKVVARSSVFRLKGQGLDVSEIGERLNVGAVLEGTVRKAGDRLRITTQLVNAADGFEIWSDRYDSQMKDVFDVQDEICRAMVGALEAELLVDPSQRIVSRPTENLKAYELYLRGRHHLVNLTRDELERSKAYFEEAMRLDPNYPLSHVGLARYYGASAATGFAAPEGFVKAEAFLTKALQIDNSVALAHTIMGAVKSFRWEWSAAEQALQRAVDLDPDLAEAHFFYAGLLQHTHTAERAAAEARRAVELDLLQPRYRSALAHYLLLAGRHDQALREVTAALKVDELYLTANRNRGWILFETGHPQEAAEALKKAQALSGSDPWTDVLLARVHAADDRQGEARLILAALKDRRKQSYAPAAAIAQVHFALGEDDRAFEWWETAFQERNPLLPAIRYLPRFRGFERLADDPRYHDLLRRMNVPPPR